MSTSNRPRHEASIVVTDDAPLPAGPYVQGIALDGDAHLVFTSGQLPIDPRSGSIVGTDVASQARQALANALAILSAAGSSPEHVVKVTIFLADRDHMGTLNPVYERFFPTSRPARSVVTIVGLPMGALVEVEMVGRLVRMDRPDDD